MNLSTLLVAIWVVLVCISQYFLNWIVFSSTGLAVIGFIGLIGVVLWLFWGYLPIKRA
jgi:hypothetical protein